MISLRPLRLSERSIPQTVDNPSDPVSHKIYIEIDQQPQTFIRQPKIRKKLFLMNRSNLRDGLDLHNDQVFNNQIRAKSDFETCPFIHHGNVLLRRYTETQLPQLMCENLRINRFKEARPEPHVYSIRRIHDLLGENILRHSPDSARQDAKIAKKE
jgi:hypothetical protein